MEKVYTFDIDTFSDLHKDAIGFRPSQAFYEWMRSATDDELQAEWDELLKVLERSNAMEEERTKLAIEAFETWVSRVIAAGAKTREVAIKWMLASDEMANGDIEFFEYNNGIPYGYVKKTSV